MVGDDPTLMLMGVVPATRKAVARAHLSLDDIDVFEVNEAFASVPLAWQRELAVADDRLNVHGGAIALGHPLGASGVRILSTLIETLERTGGRFGLQTMCEDRGAALTATSCLHRCTGRCGRRIDIKRLTNARPRTTEV